MTTTTTEMHENACDTEYLGLVRRVMGSGSKSENRTGIDTVSVTGEMMRIPMGPGFPILTTKRVHFKGIVTELIMFIRGITDNKFLNDHNVHIWDANSSEEQMAPKGLKEDDLGPVYGFQWRHFGAEYGTCKDDYSGKGIDQLVGAINKIKSNPESRQNLVCAWNPLSLDKMALPPCHFAFQFIVRDKTTLDCVLYQRSGDIGLGIPYNISSYALLAYIVADICQLEVGNMAHFIGDAHIYENHIDALIEQSMRTSFKLPTLVMKKRYTKGQDVASFLEGLDVDDFSLEGYHCHAAIKMDMAV